MVKSKVTAGLLGIFLGGLGIHKFYLGKGWQGILYLLFCWTFIPAIVGFIEGIIYLTLTDEVFEQRYDPDYREKEYVPVAVPVTAPYTVPQQTVTKEIIREREIVYIRCQHCGAKNVEGSSFCENCGAKL